MSLLLAFVLMTGDLDLPRSLAEDERPRQDVEQDRQRPAEEPMPVMEFVYLHSRFEAGVMYTYFDGDLDVENDPGVFVRYGVEVSPGWTVEATYRHYDFSNSDLDGSEDEDLLIRGLLVGAGWTRPIARDFLVEAHAGFGILRWETNLSRFSDDTGPILALEASATVRLYEVLRLKTGVGLDAAWTDFHQDSTETMLSFVWLVGLEFGF